MEQREDGNSLQDLIEILWKRKYGMGCIFITVVGVVIIITLIQTPVYEIVSTIMVRYGREYVYRPVDRLDKGGSQSMLTYKSDEVINTLLEIFRSKELIETVVKELGVEKLYPTLAEKKSSRESDVPLAISLFKKKLSVMHIKGSSVIGVSFQHQNPAVAVEAVTLLNERFKERHLQVFKNPQTGFLEEQVVEYRRKLQESEDVLKEFKQKNQIYDLDEQRKFLIQQLVAIKTVLINGKSRSTEMLEMTSSLREQMEDLPEEVMLFGDSQQDKNLNDARAQLLKFKIHEREIIEKYTEDNRLLKAVRKDIKMVEDFLADAEVNVGQTIRTGKSVVFQKLEGDLVNAIVEYNSQQAKNEVIESEVASLEKRLQELSEQEIELKRLMLLVETVEKSYKNFVVKLEENRIHNSMDNQKIVNIVVIEKPMIPVKPIKPRKKLNVLVGIILGVAASMTYAVFFEYVVGQVRTNGRR